MLCYDFFVKIQFLGLANLLGLYRERDEPYIGFNSLKMFIKRPFTKNNSVYEM